MTEGAPRPAKQRYRSGMDRGSPPSPSRGRSSRLAAAIAILAGCAQASTGTALDDGGPSGEDACANCTMSDWQYRMPLTFDAAAPGSGVPVLVVLDSTSFMYAHAADDGSDLRFSLDADPLVFEIPHWIESWEAGGTSFVWLRVPEVAVGTNKVWAFYGHRTGVATTDDFAQVFPDTLRTTGNVTLTGMLRHDAVIVEAGHTVTVAPATPLSIEAAFVQIAGTINADAAGYAAATGPGAGGGSSSGGAGGGGHGGAGGLGGIDSGDTPGAAGVANGDATSETIDMGSGGGTGTDAGGRGGGAVSVTAQRIVLAGSITAKGQAGTGGTRSGGGGAGGGVLLLARSIAFTGSIAVDGGIGGSGSATANDGGGGGGGGRIKLLHAGSVVATGTTALAGGEGGRYGDSSYGRPGSPGTLHVGTTSVLGDLPALGNEEPL